MPCAKLNNRGPNPLDYGTKFLQQQQSSGEADTAGFDMALTSAMLHDLADLRVGRVRSKYHTHLPDPRLRQYDPVERLRARLAAGKLKAAEPSSGRTGESRRRWHIIASCPGSRIRCYRDRVRRSYPAALIRL